jgi:CheY-like chemotaxis protein
MGLAIVKSLVELHGGVVSVSSEGEGQGTTFTVKLPISAVRRDENLGQGKGTSNIALQIGERDDLVGIKILVVDDEKDTCDLLRFVLEQTGAIVETANSAEEALLRFASFQPDMLVSDIGMPGVDGFELLRVLRDERHSQIPAVALTAMARVEDRLKTLAAGYQMHVSKPVEPMELINIVASLVPW